MSTSTERSLGYWCSLVGKQYLQALRKRLAHLDIDQNYLALVHIAEVDGPISQQELADKLHMDKVAVVRAVDHLSEHGYIKRVLCPNDRRKHHLKLLPKAIPAVKEIKQAYAALDRMALKDLNSDGRGQLIHQLQKALDSLLQASSQEAEKPKK